MTAAAHPLEWLISTLGGLAEFLYMLASRMKGWALYLTLYVSTLDEIAVDWRSATSELPSPFALAPDLT